MTYDMKVERLIDASPEEVFDAFVDSDAMKEWYKLQPDWTTTIEAYDPKVGGTTSITFGGEERYREDIAYTELDRPHRLVYTETMRRLQDEVGSMVTTVAVTFEAQGTKTLVILEQLGFEDADRRDAHQGGWPQFLARLDEVIVQRRAA